MPRSIASRTIASASSCVVPTSTTPPNPKIESSRPVRPNTRRSISDSPFSLACNQRSSLHRRFPAERKSPLRSLGQRAALAYQGAKRLRQLPVVRLDEDDPVFRAFDQDRRHLAGATVEGAH